MRLKFLILNLLNFWIVLATIPNQNDTSIISKHGINNNANSLDGPLKRLVETGTLQTPCVNNTVNKITEVKKNSKSSVPSTPIASHRNFYRTIKEPPYYLNIFEQGEKQPSQQQQPQEQQQQQQSQFDYELNKHPFFYYYFTTKQAQQTTKPETTTPILKTTTSTTTAASLVQNSQIQYEPKLRFVFGMPMSTLENYHPGIKTYFNRLDPHAYFPKQLRPKFMTVTAPYQPLYHIIRAIVVPDELLEGQQAQQQSPLIQTVEKLN